MKLFVSEGNPHCLKALAAVQVTGAQCDVQYVNHEGKTAWLAEQQSVNLPRQLPFAESDTGRPLNVIL